MSPNTYTLLWREQVPIRTRIIIKTINFFLLNLTILLIFIWCKIWFNQAQRIQTGLDKINESTLELQQISETLLQQDESIVNNNEKCLSLQKEINGTRLLIEELETIVDNSIKELSLKNEQIKSTKEQMNELIDKTLPIISTSKSLLNEINPDDLSELR